MKKLLLSCLFFLGMLLNAQINLGSGTTPGRLPVDSYYGYSYTQQIFTKAEIGASAANITGVKFYLGATASLTNTTAWKVYLGHTTKTDFTSTTDWIPVTQLTQVFDGNVTNVNGVVTITFSTPFAYNNVDNLVIACDENTSSYNGIGDRFYGYTGPANSTLYFIDDAVNPDPAAPPAGTQVADKSVVTLLGLTPSAPPACPTGLVPADAATNVSKNATLTWAASTGATSYDVYLGTTATPALVANVTSTSYQPSPVLNSNTVYYWKIVPKNAAGSAVGCTQQSFTTNDQLVFCTPVYTTGTTWGDLISNVEVAGTTLSNNSGTTAGGPSYTYYTGQPNYTGSMQAGATYNVTVTVGSYGDQNVAVWIDYNDNGIFESSERVGYSTTAIAGNGTATFPITLACNPPLGTHRMRVRDVWSTAGSSIDPCSSYGYGETEDYDVTITAAAACPAPSMGTASNITTTGATLAWNKGCTETAWDVHVAAAGSGAPTGTPSHPGATPNTGFAVSGLTANTNYEFWVRANCGAGSFSTWAGPYTFTTAPLPPANDNCAAAIALTVNPDLNCGIVTAGTTIGATASTETAPTCGATGTNDDVWFKFVATNTSHQVKLTNVSNFTDMAMSAYTGACGSLVAGTCSDPDTMSLSGLTVGTTYYVRVWTWSSSTTTATFDICVGTPPPPPANDACSSAISVAAFTTTYTSYTNTQDASGATNNGGFVSCGATGMNDGVWYSITGNGTTYTVAVTGATGWDSAIGVYTGSCGNFTCVGSVDAGGTGGDETFSFGTMNGTTYYINIGQYSSSTDNPEGPFTVTVSTDGVMGTSEIIADAKDVKIYPNPFTDVLNISDIKNVKNVSVIDMSGRIVKTIPNPVRELHLGDLTSGTYVLKVNYKDGTTKTVKAIKK